MKTTPRQLTLGIAPGSHLDFDSFVAGANDNLLRLLQQDGADPAATFIYIWGETGAGKTHLLHAACRAAERRAALLPLASPGQWQPAILEGWESLDLVALDDVHGIAGSHEWERRLFALYNGLRETNARLLIAADRPPAALELILPDLQSRLGAMLVWQLHALDDDGRLQAMTRKARARGLELPEDVGRYLLTRVSRNMIDLAALLDRLDQASLARQRRLTIPFVREQLEEAMPRQE